MPWRALLHPKVPSTHVHRDHTSASTLTHATHTRKVPNLRISPRRCTAFEGEFSAASVKRLAQLGAQVGKLVAQQFLRSGTIALRGRETPSALVQELKVTEGGARRDKLPDVRHVRGWSSLCQFAKSASHRWIGKVMLGTHSLHSEGVLIQLHRLGTRKPPMPPILKTPPSRRAHTRSWPAHGAALKGAPGPQLGPKQAHRLVHPQRDRAFGACGIGSKDAVWTAS